MEEIRLKSTMEEERILELEELHRIRDAVKSPAILSLINFEITNVEKGNRVGYYGEFVLNYDAPIAANNQYLTEATIAAAQQEDNVTCDDNTDNPFGFLANPSDIDEFLADPQKVNPIPVIDNSFFEGLATDDGTDPQKDNPIAPSDAIDDSFFEGVDQIRNSMMHPVSNQPQATEGVVDVFEGVDQQQNSMMHPVSNQPQATEGVVDVFEGVDQQQNSMMHPVSNQPQATEGVVDVFEGVDQQQSAPAATDDVAPPNPSDPCDLDLRSFLRFCATPQEVIRKLVQPKKDNPQANRFLKIFKDEDLPALLMNETELEIPDFLPNEFWFYLTRSTKAKAKGKGKAAKAVATRPEWTAGTFVEIKEGGKVIGYSRTRKLLNEKKRKTAWSRMEFTRTKDKGKSEVIVCKLMYKEEQIEIVEADEEEVEED